MASALTVVEISRHSTATTTSVECAYTPGRGLSRARHGERGYLDCPVGPDSPVWAFPTRSWARVARSPPASLPLSEQEVIAGHPDSCWFPNHLLPLAVQGLGWTSQMGVSGRPGDGQHAGSTSPCYAIHTEVLSRQASVVVFLVKTKAIYSSFLITFPSAQQPVPSVSPTPSSDQLVGGPTWQLSVSWIIKSPSQATGLSSRAPG